VLKIYGRQYRNCITQYISTQFADEFHLAPLVLVVPLILLHQQDQNLSENLHKIDEQIERVGNEVTVSVLGLPDDDLSVEHDEATEYKEPDVQMDLEQQLGSEENVEKPKDEEGVESGEESSTEIEILTVRSEQCSSGETSEDNRGQHHC